MGPCWLLLPCGSPACGLLLGKPRSHARECTEKYAGWFSVRMCPMCEKCLIEVQPDRVRALVVVAAVVGGRFWTDGRADVPSIRLLIGFGCVLTCTLQ